MKKQGLREGIKFFVPARMGNFPFLTRFRRGIRLTLIVTHGHNQIREKYCHSEQVSVIPKRRHDNQPLTMFQPCSNQIH
uniref:Uncharacterized protein n=1 Tax=Candidatus Kentrum sp. MB TaxID=2138164 RepID=A0A450WZM8_9GAMM|nr:MAG: hypothetical protein BECKMB1821G_GA0114241_100232 [Candidatus Kentron sp. MB]